jgi:UDP-galactopyranose mutase
MPATPVLVVFSHLRWGFVFQRPQHLLSRLAGRWRVLFVEEPVHTEGPSKLEARHPSPQLTVLLPHTSATAPGFHDDQLALLQPLIAGYLENEHLRVDVAWLYTPMALPLAQAVAPRCVVYDCMDELSAFKGAPLQLRQRESALLKLASLVLTGGPSLYEARRDRHTNVHCIPSAVDAAHFAPAHLQADSPHATQTQLLQGALPRPRLGFFGVIDERLDLGLVATLADSHPEWTLVMVGPVVKIDAATLPQRPNIQWLGMQPYERLPYLLAGWDLCLMPFALNESTQFISPTKTLEYMAGDKPVVSTPVRDVISLYGDAVAVAAAPRPFMQACETVLAEPPKQRCARAMNMATTVSMHSWDRSADTVHGLLAQALAQAPAQADPRQRQDAAARATLPGPALVAAAGA